MSKATFTLPMLLHDPMLGKLREELHLNHPIEDYVERELKEYKDLLEPEQIAVVTRTFCTMQKGKGKNSKLHIAYVTHHFWNAGKIRYSIDSIEVFQDLQTYETERVSKLTNINTNTSVN
jgi:hypothetical protein